MWKILVRQGDEVDVFAELHESLHECERVFVEHDAVAHAVDDEERIAQSRIDIDQSRLLTLRAAYMMDTVGNKVARKEIAMIKVAAPNTTLRVLDWAIQAHGGGGVSQEFMLAYWWAHSRTLRLADGPDEVHRNQIARLELRRWN